MAARPTSGGATVPPDQTRRRTCAQETPEGDHTEARYPRTETAVQAAERRASAVLESVSDAFVALDRDWRYTYVNRKAGDLFGREPADLVGKHIWTEFPEGVGQPFHLVYEKVMDERVPAQLEEYYPPWDRWFQNRIYPFEEGLAIYFTDVTERKRAEDLQAGERQVLELIAIGAPLRDILDTLARQIEAQSNDLFASILLLDDDGVHLRHGAAPSLPEGYTRAIDGTPIGEGVGSCGTAAFRGQPVVVEDIATDPLWEDYRELALAHGLHACWSTPIFDAEQRVLGTFALYLREPVGPTDCHRRLIESATHAAAIAITRERREKALRRSEASLASAQAQARLGSWELDLATGTGTWSAEMFRLMGLDPSAGPPTFAEFLELLEPEDRRPVAEYHQHASGSGEPATFEFRTRPPGGPVRYFSIQVDPTRSSDGRVAGLSGTVLDITGRRQAEDELRQVAVDLERRVAERTKQLEAAMEKAQAADRLKSIFLATMSHELRTPLNSIIGFTGILLQRLAGPLNEEQAKQLGMVGRSARHLLALINDVLDISKIEAGQLEVQLAPFEMRDVIDSVLRAISPQAQSKGLSVVSAIHPRVGTVVSDRRRVEQVILNLVTNAIKFTERGEVRLECQVGLGSVVTRVHDTGIGIQPRDLEHLFTPFHQIEGGLGRRREGTGLGLSICKNLASLLGGEVRAQSQWGAGSTFTFTLPLGQ